MSKRILSVAVVSALTLVACASGGTNYSADQCTALDWYALGVKDGKAGANLTEVNDDVASCKEHGISADIETYKKGRTEGLKSYCEPSTLAAATLQSAGDPFSCEPFTTQQKAAFEKGRDTRTAAGRYQQYKAQYDQLLQQKQQINNEGSQLAQRLQTEQDENLKAQINQRIGQLREQFNQVNAKLAEAEPIMKKEAGVCQTAITSFNSFRSENGASDQGLNPAEVCAL